MVLGHSGMLGNAVMRYFSQFPEQYTLLTTNERWGDNGAFNESVSSTDADFIINCIGAIPQKYSQHEDNYQKINIDLPIFLDSIGRPIVHPSTDCEFSGTIPAGEKYKKKSLRDATDAYGISKALISKKIEETFANTKIIRTSIIGHELGNKKFSLLEWVLSTKDTPIRGYTDHYWNGVTTIQWCKICETLIKDWGQKEKLNQFGTEKIASKYDLVRLILKIYMRKVDVEPYMTGTIVNKCLESDVSLPPIEKQLEELRMTYTHDS